MALRIARGSFRLWIVVSLLWVTGMAATNWGQLFYYRPVIVDEQPPGRLQTTLDTCKNARSADECSSALKAAGKNPFDAYDLTWEGGYLSLPDNAVMVPVGMARERAGHAAALAFIPPAFVLVIGSALGWVLKGFRS